MFSLVWNIVYWLVKSHCFQFSGEVENTVFFEPERWWKYDIYILLKSSFGLFGNGKYSLFLRQKVNEKMIFTDYWNVPVLIFLGKENTVFLRQIVDGKMIFTDYWKVLVLSFSVMKIAVFFETKRMIFTDYWKVIVLSFLVKGNKVLFLAKKLM